MRSAHRNGRSVFASTSGAAPALLFATVALCACAGDDDTRDCNATWVETFAGRREDPTDVESFSQQVARAIAVHPNGQLTLSGYFERDIDLGGPTRGPDPALGAGRFFGRFDGCGRFLHGRQRPGALNVWSDAFELDAQGGMAFIEWASPQERLVKLDHELHEVWTVGPDPAVGFLDLRATGDSGVVAGGYYSGTVSLPGVSVPTVPAGQNVSLVARFDRAGKAVWARAFGGSASLHAVRTDPEGNIVVAGIVPVPRDPIDFGGGPVERSAPGEELFAVGLGPSGDHRWSKRFGGDPAEHGSNPMALLDVDVDANGDLVMAGRVSTKEAIDFGGGPLARVGDRYDVFLVKLGKGGEHAWSRRFGTDDDSPEIAVTVAPDRDLLVRVGPQGPSRFDAGGGLLEVANGAFVALFDANGALVASEAQPGIHFRQSGTLSGVGDPVVAPSGDWLVPFSSGLSEPEAPRIGGSLVPEISGGVAWLDRTLKATRVVPLDVVLSALRLDAKGAVYAAGRASTTQSDAALVYIAP